jgi:translation initiation factor 4E
MNTYLNSETVKRILNLPDGTHIIWRSHDDSIAQRTAIDQARHEKNHQGHEKRRVTSTDESQRDKSVAGS